MKNLLIILLSFLFMACDHSLAPQTDHTQNFSYCKANFIPSSWNVTECIESGLSTCCKYVYYTDYNDAYRLSETEMCFDHDSCIWNPVMITRLPEMCYASNPYSY